MVPKALVLGGQQNGKLLSLLNVCLPQHMDVTQMVWVMVRHGLGVVGDAGANVTGRKKGLFWLLFVLPDYHFTKSFTVKASSFSEALH